MKELETVVKTFGEGLRVLAQGVQAVADKLESFVNISRDVESEFEPAADHNIRPTEPEKASEEASSPAPAINVTGMVYEKISESAGPVTIDELEALTGVERKKLHNIVYRLKKQGRIKNVSKGVYVKC